MISNILSAPPEFEALVLEASLIKQNMHKYNILLKDDKGYHYIKITKPPFRRITSEVQKINDGSTYLGPYTSGFVTKKHGGRGLQDLHSSAVLEKIPRRI